MYAAYCEKNDLRQEHADSFGLDTPLAPEEFNRKQKLIIVGTSADRDVVRSVNYWKNSGIDIDFLPYRFYDINGSQYFEFFAKPYDDHLDPTAVKGVIFDTNRTFDEYSIWDMFSQSKVSAYGSVRDCVQCFKPGDYVLYYHKGMGVVGAAQIIDGIARANPAANELYMKVSFITPQVDSLDKLRGISAAELKSALGKGFFFAKTTKNPYLSESEVKILLDILRQRYQ